MAAPVQDLFYEKLISAYVDSDYYLERRWLEDRLHARLRLPQVRFVLITGKPGAGKSSFAAGMARKNERWLRYFIRRDQRLPLGGTGSRTFLLQIGFQFAALYPEAFHPQYLEMRIRNRVGRVAAGGQLVGVKIQQLLASPFFRAVIDISQQVQENQGTVTGLQVEQWVSDPHLLPIEDLAYVALIDPAAALLESRPQARLVVLIDALDEMRFHSRQDGVLEWLAACPDLPSNCKYDSLSPADKSLARSEHGNRRRLVYELLEALDKPPADALVAISPYLDPGQALDVRIKGVVVLAMAETHAPHALTKLEELLVHPERFIKNKRDRSHLRWCAADGLLALNDPACIQDLQTAFWEPDVKPWVRQIILYVLGRMHAGLPVQELRQMIDTGLKNPQTFLPRVVDSIELLAPASGRARKEWASHYQGVLLAGLGLSNQSNFPTWHYPLLVKRAVVALGRIGTIDTIVPLQSYLEGIEAEELPETQKKNILKAGRRALDDLSRRNNVSERVSIDGFSRPHHFQVEIIKPL
jgi:HEAT repeat protein